MMDRLTPAQRSAHMARIRRADTKPERIVRRLLHRLGYRFRVQQKGVPGRPDVAFPGRRKAIMVHGCFWHQHPGCRLAHVPTTRSEFWQAKFARNKERDARLESEAEALGWEVLVVWECETREEASLADRLEQFIGPPKLAPR
jgi:DNA mismatch endonuclease (patch repair protein)